MSDMEQKPLRVMQLVLSLAIGGLEKLVYDIVRQLQSESISSVICCLDELGVLGQQLQREGYPIYVLSRQPGLAWSMIPRLRDILLQEKIEVIHAHTYTSYFYGLLAAWYCMFTGEEHRRPKVVYTAHGRLSYPDIRKVKRMLANPILSVFTDEIVTISESTKRSLVKYENFPKHRIKVIYNGIELHRFLQPPLSGITKQSFNLTPDSNVIGMIARLDPIKNHCMLLRAFKKVCEQVPDTYLFIVGDGPEMQRIQTFASSIGVMENTLFLGERHDIPELLHMFDIFVLSSFNEGMSVTLLEAMAAGLPIVATNVGGNSEVLSDRQTGFLVPNDDDGAMAERLVTLLQDKAMRDAMGKAGRQRAQEQFSLNRMVDTYTEQYFNLAGNR